jgi:acetyl esterase/lipase
MTTTSTGTFRLGQRGTRTGSFRAPGRANPSGGGVGVRVLHDIPYAAAGGDRHKLDLYLPDRQVFPVVVFAHGGGWVWGDKALHGHLGTYLAKHGIGAVVINYRLAPQVCHPVPAQDLARAFAWTQKHLGAHGGDTDRLYLCGHSAGAHSVALLGTDESFLRAEGLSFEHVRGVVAISGVYRIHWNVSVAGFGAVFRGADRRAASPSLNIKPGCPPFLVMRARKELWTLSHQASRFHKKLLRHGCRSRLVVAPGEDHHTIIQTVSLPTASHGKEILRFVHEG